MGQCARADIVLLQHPLVSRDIILCHFLSAKALANVLAAANPTDIAEVANRADKLVGIAGDEPDLVVDNLGYGTAAVRNHRSTTGERLDHHQAEGLLPVDWDQQRPGALKQL